MQGVSTCCLDLTMPEKLNADVFRCSVRCFELELICSGNAPPSRRSAELRVMLVWLERAEDMLHFPAGELP